MTLAEVKMLMSSVLYQAKTAETKEDIIIAIEAMCEKEWVAHVNEKVAEFRREKKS